MLGVSFLTPLGALFALAAAIPLAALALAERRSARIRRLFALTGPRRRALVPTVAALVLLPALVGVAAAQPVVVHQKLLRERGDAEAFFVFDTSLSMRASAAPGAASRLTRAKRLALRLRALLPDVPVGIASMTDRTLPNMLPTTDAALFARTLSQAVGIDQPPPSQLYPGRATTFEALVPVIQRRFFSTAAQRKLIVVFTDGESSRLTPGLRYSIERGHGLLPIFVHVWAPGERIFARNGRADPAYRSDPASGDQLASFASLVGGRELSETQPARLGAMVSQAVGRADAQRRVERYARIALAPWFVLGGAVPLAFLLWRRNL